MTLPQAVVPGPIAANARCATCGSPLAPDQSFCLSCGTRRRDARIAFRDVLATEAAPVVASPAGGGGGWPPSNGALAAGAPQGPQGPGRVTYMPFLATLGLLLLALSVGIWIGRKPEKTAAAAPVVIPAAAAAVPTTPATTPTDAAASDDASAKDSSKDDSSAVDESSAPVKDDTSKLKQLEKLSPEDYQKQSQKLPDEVGTGGKAPPKDNKPAGAGSETETFN